MSCPKPIDAAVLADYWLALLSGPGEETVEEHLFECDACGERSREIIALAEGVRELARQGSLKLIVTDAYLRRAQEQGARVRQYSAAPGGDVRCTVTAEDDMLIGRLAADLTHAERVDLVWYSEQGEIFRQPDIPFHRGPTEVISHESITQMKAAPDMKLVARLVALDEAHAERVVGEYTFRHTRSLP
jgi:hypothetical protein